MNKTRASDAQLAKCILLYSYSCTTAVPSCASTNVASYSLFNKLAQQYFGL